MASADPTTGAAQLQQVHTYHCLCAQLVLASTTPLRSLATRTSDGAYICPLPASPASGPSLAEAGSATAHYVVLHDLPAERKPLVTRHDDGFEKRYLARCARCRLTVGYWLDWGQFEGAAGGAGGASGKGLGRREDVVYLLPGGLIDTEDMVVGKGAEEGQGRVTVGA